MNNPNPIAYCTVPLGTPCPGGQTETCHHTYTVQMASVISLYVFTYYTSNQLERSVTPHMSLYLHVHYNLQYY